MNYEILDRLVNNLGVSVPNKVEHSSDFVSLSDYITVVGNKTFEKPGLYEISLTVTDNHNGKKITDKVAISIDDLIPPVAVMSSPSESISVEAPYTIQLNGEKAARMPLSNRCGRNSTAP